MLHGVSVYYLPHNLQYYIIPYIIVFTITGTHVDTHKEEHIEMQNCSTYEITKPRLQSPQHRNLAAVVDNNPAQ